MSKLKNTMNSSAKVHDTLVYRLSQVLIERLAHDLREAFPEMKGFSPRNLKYMRAFAEAWPDAEFVQAVLAQLPWYHQLALLDKLTSPEARRWYAAKAIEHNWSRNVLVIQIETRLRERNGAAVTNFAASQPACLPSDWPYQFCQADRAPGRNVQRAHLHHLQETACGAHGGRQTQHAGLSDLQRPSD